MSIFNQLNNEFTGEFYQTEPISSTPHRIQQLIIVAAAIASNFINWPYWKFIYHKGSLTFRHHFHEGCDLCKKDQHKVIKIFVDKDKKLARKEEIDHLVGDDPIVVGIELGYEDPFVQKNIRDFLRQHFRDLYLDPVAGHSKYYLDPSKHCYDIVFLREGPCVYPYKEYLREISAEVESKIGRRKRMDF